MKERPTNRSFLTLLDIQYTLSSFVSVLHRVTGILLLGVVVWLLYNFVGLFETQQKFNFIIVKFTSIEYKICLVFSLAIFVFHIVAGFRHMLMDSGFFEEMKQANVTALFVLCISFIYFISIGYLLW
jgi:succinate dehydrogenase / fumarate reductase cytochrome b subunit